MGNTHPACYSDTTSYFPQMQGFVARIPAQEAVACISEHFAQHKRAAAQSLVVGDSMQAGSKPESVGSKQAGNKLAGSTGP